MGTGNNSNTFAKTICSICYEDLKPIVEDLQSISICGHVFHELCIQQWFEYCSNGKKKNCPVCKQTCSETSACRLYFQSVGDPKDHSSSQKPKDCEINTEELCREVKRLEGKVSGLNSALELQEKNLNEVNKKLLICQGQLKKEISLKTDALKQKATIQQLLQSKSEEHDRSALECRRLQERSMALAKELAALKLASDLNLEEDEVLKLASLGTEGNTKATIDVLKKSLVIRNKSYKELMTKCNILGRGEARSLNKLEKAKEKMRKLKTRLIELETAAEVKDNELLRGLKSSRKPTPEFDVPNKYSYNDQMKQPGMVKNGFFCHKNLEMSKCTKGKDKHTDEINQDMGFDLLPDEGLTKISTSIHELSHIDLEAEANEHLIVNESLARSEGAFDTQSEIRVHGRSDHNCVSGSKTVFADLDEDVMILDDIVPDEPLLNIRKETSSSIPVIQPGESCFSGGLLGPDGSKMHLGKWCKRGQNKGSSELSKAFQGSKSNSSDLIAVGADGRGGRIKVLRPLNQDKKEASTLAKRCKYGTKTSSLQPRGSLQIEHFFGKTGQ